MGNQVYKCFDSCSRSSEGCNPQKGCNCASCMDDNQFIKDVLEHMKNNFCVDLQHIHMAGMSAGALMTYNTALRLSDEIASIAPAAGSRIIGYNTKPKHSIALLDFHGYNDDVVPANISDGMERWGGPHGSAVSLDYFYYTPLHEITKVYAEANDCDFSGNLPYPTKYDGEKQFSCNRPHGSCRNGDVVTCVGKFGHTWPLHKEYPEAYAELTIDFFFANPLKGGSVASGNATQV